MGLKPRLRAERLPEKLKTVRLQLRLSQNEILRRLGFDEIFDRTTISHYESGEREPPLPVLLQYSRLANVYLEVLVDDQIDLPTKILSIEKSKGIEIKPND